MPRTTVKAHKRKGTAGVKKHYRMTSDRKNVLNRDQTKEEAMETINLIEQKLGLYHLYMIDKMDFDVPKSEEEVGKLLGVDNPEDFIERGIREGIFLSSSRGVKLAPIKEVKQVKWYLANYFYSPYDEFKTELEDKQWKKMVGR